MFLLFFCLSVTLSNNKVCAFTVNALECGNNLGMVG